MPEAEEFSPAPIRYGVIGTGMMGIEHIENINQLDGAVVTAGSDPHEPSRAAATEAADEDIATFEGHQELLDSGLCDAIVVASPNFTHLDVMNDVLASGLHVLLEKPMCTTMADAEALVAAVEAGKADHPDRIVWVGLEYRYMPAVAALIDGVESGDVGTPQMVSITEHRFPFLVKIGDWNRFSENTGGTLVEKCCHFFDLMNMVMGERPVQVFASGGQNVNHLDEVYDGKTSDILDNAYVIVDYSNGRRAMLDLCMFAEATREQETVSVIGEKGKLEAMLPSGTLMRGRRGEHFIGEAEAEVVHDESIAHEGLHHGSSYVEHVKFCEAIRGEGGVEVTVEDGLWSVAVGAAAHRSIDEGRPVQMKEMFS